MLLSRRSQSSLDYIFYSISSATVQGIVVVRDFILCVRLTSVGKVNSLRQDCLGTARDTSRDEGFAAVSDMDILGFLVAA
jgi:hypothetical protein